MYNIFTLSSVTLVTRVTLVTLVTLFISFTTSYVTLHKGGYQLALRLRPSNKLAINAMTDANIPQSLPPGANITTIVKNTGSYSFHNMPLTADGEQLNISSIYLNIDKVKGVYFAKDVKNVIFTLPDNLSDIYYYDKVGCGTIYKVSNKTRINMKGLQRFIFQSFNNNNVDGIIF